MTSLEIVVDNEKIFGHYEDGTDEPNVLITDDPDCILKALDAIEKSKQFLTELADAKGYTPSKELHSAVRLP